MKLITIQNIAIMEVLEHTGKYVADFNRVHSNLVAPYHRMSDFYGWNTCPVFCGIIDEYAEFYGASFENSIAFQLEVPDELVKIQNYYDWTDLVFFMEIPNEFHNSYSPEFYPTIDSFAEAVLNNKSAGPNRALQATIPYIKAEWITSILADTTNLMKTHNGSGGSFILKELQDYSCKKRQTSAPETNHFNGC